MVVGGCEPLAVRLDMAGTVAVPCHARTDLRRPPDDLSKRAWGHTGRPRRISRALSEALIRLTTTAYRAHRGGKVCC